MADILFVTWDGGGNVPPAVGIAEELKTRGHRVRFLGHPRQAPAFAERGLEFSGFPTARPFDSTSAGDAAHGAGGLRRPRDGRATSSRSWPRGLPTSWWWTACCSA